MTTRTVNFNIINNEEAFGDWRMWWADVTPLSILGPSQLVPQEVREYVRQVSIASLRLNCPWTEGEEKRENAWLLRRLVEDATLAYVNPQTYKLNDGYRRYVDFLQNAMDMANIVLRSEAD